MKSKLISVMLVTFAIALLWAGSLMSAPKSGDYVDSEILVKYKQSVGQDKMSKSRGALGASVMKEFKKGRLKRLKLRQGMSVEEALEILRDDPDIEYAEPNYIRRASYQPAEYDGVSTHWNLNIIDAPGAWDIQNTCSTTVAVLDSGITSHIELAASIWSNAGEVGNCSDGIDNDDNGYVDDCYGWNFADGDKDSLSSGFIHGTHVAGIIAASGDDGGPALGVCPGGASVMSLKILDDAGNGTVADEIEALYYAKKMGVRIANLSLGGKDCSLSERDAIKDFGEAGGLVIAAAGNDGVDNDDNLSLIEFPASYDQPYIISVAASNAIDGLATFNGAESSGYGYNSVDLAAPGVVIYSTIPTDTYATYQGTSMAAPHVAGVAALLMAQTPALSNMEIKEQLLGSVGEVIPLFAKVATGGRLNAYNALSGTIPLGPTGLIASESAGEVILIWTDNATDETAYRIERMDSDGVYFARIGPALVDATWFIDTSPSAVGAFYRVQAVKNGIHKSAYSNIAAHNADTSTLYELGRCGINAVPPSGGGGGGCFIATAAYGSAVSAELDLLRHFRDSVLMSTSLGRSLVSFYYRNSPPLADTIQDTPALKAAVKGTLIPVVLALKYPAVIAMTLMAAAAFTLRRRHKKGSL